MITEKRKNKENKTPPPHYIEIKEGKRDIKEFEAP